LSLPLPTTVDDPKVQQALDAIAAAFPVQGKWQAPTFQNSWENYEVAGTWIPAAYRKGMDGRVTIRGLVKHAGATGTSTIFTLPIGFRPSKQLVFGPWCQTGAVGQPRRVDVASTGEVFVFAPAESVDYLSLNLSFYPD
jgi:hypothetical protein